MFQQDLLVPWKTVLGNAAFAARMARPRRDGAAPRARRAPRAPAERARELLEEFGLGDVLDALPGGLSGGMRQRVALGAHAGARARARPAR